MKVALDSIDIGPFSVREAVDEEHVSQIAESLEEDGQWDPIIVRPNENGGYEMIAGHTRYRAARQIGWDELEANVKNVDEEEAENLALKTNLKRKGMTKIEEGKAINQMLRNQGLTQRELANKLGKSQRWVSERVKVALELAPEVRGLVEEGDISYNIARIVTQVDENRQLDLAKILVERDITQAAEASQTKNQFENDTVYTVGYEGSDFSEFANKLKYNDVDILVDVRKSSSSTYKPEFSREILEDRLAEHNIEYRHESELGVHNLIRNPYKEGAIGHDCFESWYDWWVSEESNVDVESFTKNLNEEGAPALMCIEKYTAPTEDQDIYCHRHHLANLMQDVERQGRAVFPNQKDI